MKKYLVYFLNVLYILPVFILSGCVATSQDVAELRLEIYEMKAKLNALSSVQKNQADLSGKMDDLNKNLTALNEQLEDTKTRTSTLSEKLDDIHLSLSKRLEILSQQLEVKSATTEPTPSELYKISYSDYSRGKYDLSIIGFKSFLERYPNTERAPDAQFYLADSYYNKNDFEKALQQFDKLIKDYTYSEYTVTSKYKKALCLLEMQKSKEAKEILKQIIKENPQSPEAQQSDEKLKSLQE